MAVRPPKRPRDWEKVGDSIHSGFLSFWIRAGLFLSFGIVGVMMFRLGLFTPQENMAIFEWLLGLTFLLWVGIIVLLLRNRVFVPLGWSYEGFRELLRRTGKNPFASTLGDKRYFFILGCLVASVIIASILTGTEEWYLGLARPLFVVGLFVWIVIKVTKQSMSNARKKNGNSPFANGMYYSQLDRDIENIKKLWNKCLYKFLEFLERLELK